MTAACRGRLITRREQRVVAWHGSCRPSLLEIQGVLVASSGRRPPAACTPSHLSNNRSSSSRGRESHNLILTSEPLNSPTHSLHLLNLTAQNTRAAPHSHREQKKKKRSSTTTRNEGEMSSSQNPFSHASRNNTTAQGRTSSPFHRSPWGGSPADMMDQPFTDEMRDLQARGKDPYAGDASDGSDLSPERLPGGGRMAPHHQHHPHHHHAQHHHHHSHHHHRAASSRWVLMPQVQWTRGPGIRTDTLYVDNPRRPSPRPRGATGPRRCSTTPSC